MKIEDQPTPQPNSQPAIVDLVIQDLQERKQVGIDRYGVALQAFNGRNALIDAYQEKVDELVYFRQFLEEYERLIKLVDQAIDVWRFDTVTELNAFMSKLADLRDAQGANSND